IKTQFLAYDSMRHEPINQRCFAPKRTPFVPTSGDPWLSNDPNADIVGFKRAEGQARVQLSNIVLPSVGRFTEGNWRSKMKILASNIDQLRALPWCWAAKFGRGGTSNGTYGTDPYHYDSPSTNLLKLVEDYHSTGSWPTTQFSFPWYL